MESIKARRLRGAKPIRLTRSFAIGGTLIVAAAAISQAHFHKELAISGLVRMIEQSTLSTSFAFGNIVWPRFADFVNAAHTRSQQDILFDPATGAFDSAVRELISDTRVIGVKVYDANGITVFSSDPAEIGGVVMTNNGYRTALSSGTVSDLVHHPNFLAVSGMVRDVYLVETYVPVRRGGGNAPVEGVLETYTDVTDLHAGIIRTGWERGLLVAATLAVVFLLLMFTVWRADRQIQREHAHNLELTKSIARAESASRAKSEFLANMSHELRTPLNAVIGFSEVLRTEMLGPLGNERYRGYADDIHNSGTHLLGIINDVLDLAKVEAGKMTVSLQTTQLADLIRDVTKLMHTRAEQRGVQLKAVIPETVGIVTDPHKLRQILINLLSNAIKFTPHGGAVALATQRADAGAKIVISVSDTGIGMRAEDIPIALAAFGQVDSSLARQFEGTGLGLPLTKRFAELLGGDIEIESAPGEGTTVRVILPVRGPQLEELARAA
jgi:signal transduction histidine kinase